MNFVLAVDFDGTLFTGTWNVRGEPVMPVILQTKRFCNHPHCEVILWTCREEVFLTEAIERCGEHGLVFDAVNSSTMESLRWNQLNFGRLGQTSMRKAYADLYVDDKSPGSIEYFLTLDPDTEWGKVRNRKTE
jgi:hypothetical protein